MCGREFGAVLELDRFLLAVDAGIEALVREAVVDERASESLIGVLMSLGMMMVPPNLISLPLKVGVFLLADGWHLLVSSLLRSFQ